MAHLHINRAYVPLQTVAIEASPDQARDTEREWYYSNKSKEKEGPYSFKEVRNERRGQSWVCFLLEACPVWY